jgi:hypothetical protein
MNRPYLTVEIAGSERNLHNPCCVRTRYKITTTFRLQPHHVIALENGGLLGIGQELIWPDLKIEATGTDPIQEQDQYGAYIYHRPYWEYLFVRVCDSSD